MMKQLILVGARHFGREAFHLATQCIGYGTCFEIKGYLDDNADALSTHKGYPPIIGAVETYEVQEDDCFFCALGDPVFKKKYVDMIVEKNGAFQNLIHQSAILYSDCHIGQGVAVSQFCTISCNVLLEDFVTIYGYSDVGHDARIGRYSTMEAYSFMGGFAEVGSQATVHTGAKILPYKKVGNNAIVGAGSVVIRNVKDGKTVFGNPAIEIYA